MHRKECAEPPAVPQKGDARERVLATIRELDTGKGAEYEIIAKRIGDGADPALRRMLSDGEIFETAPGRFKILE